MSLQQQAHGASLIGDRAAVDHLIDTADGLLCRVDDDLPWGNACRRTQGYLEVQRATCYGRLGLGVEAGALWPQVLDTVPPTARRDRGVYMARHATAGIARAVAEIAVETRSARMRRELGTPCGPRPADGPPAGDHHHARRWISADRSGLRPRASDRCDRGCAPGASARLTPDMTQPPFCPKARGGAMQQRRGGPSAGQAPGRCRAGQLNTAGGLGALQAVPVGQFAHQRRWFRPGGSDRYTQQSPAALPCHRALGRR